MFNILKVSFFLDCLYRMYRFNRGSSVYFEYMDLFMGDCKFYMILVFFSLVGKIKENFIF